MSAKNTFEDFLANQAPQVDIGQFIINLGTAGALAALMAFMYSRWGRGQAHRGQFAANFFLITMTTMLVISVVKSSLALSLGLVGALSVIRFRTAIKDPEELAFLFLAIAVGLGLGADQRTITVIGLTFILLVYLVLKMRSGPINRPGTMYLHLSGISTLSIGELEQLIGQYVQKSKLKRWHESEAIFLIEPRDVDGLDKMKSSLKEKMSGVNVLMTEYQDIA